MISAAEYREAGSTRLSSPPTRRPRPRVRTLPGEGSPRSSRRSWDGRHSRSGGSGSTPPWTPGCSARPWRPPTTSSPAPDDPSAAVVTVEPQSGAIRALAGQEGSFNLPLDARRQPGSAFKPIVLAAALKENISPQSTYVSRELDFCFQEKDYVIGNYESVERGEISVSEAMAESDNTVFVQARRRRRPQERGGGRGGPGHHDARRALPFHGDRRPGRGRQPP